MKKVLGVFLSLVLVSGMMLLSGCSKNAAESKNTSADKKLAVYTSIYPMYDLTKKIGGDKITVTNLVPAGQEPHDWEPTPSDMANLEKADVLIYNGAGMEHWIDKVLSSIQNKKLIAVETSKELHLLDNPDKSEELKYDPHVWLNPRLAKQQMEAIKKALVTADSSNKDYYEKNYTDNAKKLDDLDQEYKAAVSKFSQKDIVVAHQAFGYLCDAYGLKQVSIEGLLADSEPSPAKMAEIVKFAKENKLKYIFYEELVSPKVAEAIAKEIGVTTAMLNPIEGLQESDLLAGKEYISVMRDNLEVLKKALQ
ncbi:metal ABC transporter substrate-binding protein [Desulfosporosinus fructosivorans]